MSMHCPPPEDPPGKQPAEPPPPPVDDPFLERVFSVMCQHIPLYPGETFVDQVRRWFDTLHFMAELRPRTGAECLLAADVAMKDRFVQETLAHGKDLNGRRRQQQGHEFILRTQELHDAQLGYSLLRSRKVA